MYARQGLRVLVMAKRVISPKKYADWLAKYETAELIFEGRERRMRELYSEMENHLSLIGRYCLFPQTTPHLNACKTCLISSFL